MMKDYKKILSNKNIQKIVCVLAAFACLYPSSLLIAAETEEMDVFTVESKAERDARMSWWRDAKFGMFIHWGVYAVAAGSHNGKQTPGAGEWIMENMEIPVAEYKEYAKYFNPVKYAPEQWVIMAKKTGMKYIVLTSKHHDGFALFDSKVTNWDVVDATPYGKDLIEPLVAACRKHGMKLGFYYSQAQDWSHPGGGSYKAKWDDAQRGDFDKYLHEIAIPQTREILTKYGDIAIIWWDTPVGMSHEEATELYKLAREINPSIIMNNRLGGGYGDTETPEQSIPATGYKDRDWEVCMTLNNTWGYSEHDKNWKTPERVLKNLIDIVSKGGNYLINVGPKGDGSIPVETVDCFSEVGQWMHINGEAIYGTTASPFKKLSWGRCTKRVDADGVTLYLHVFEWPEDGTLLLPGLKNNIRSANTMWDPVLVQTEKTDRGVLVKVPGRVPGNLERPEVIALKLEGFLTIEPIVLQIKGNDDFELSVVDADLSGSLMVEQKANNLNNIGYWIDKKDIVFWTFKSDTAGEFDLVTSVATEGDTNLNVLLDDGNQSNEVSIKATGSYSKFEDNIKLGTFKIPANKKVMLTLIPAEGKWNPINLRDIKAIKK